MRGYDLQVRCSDDRWRFGMETEKKLAKGRPKITLYLTLECVKNTLRCEWGGLGTLPMESTGQSSKAKCFATVPSL